MQPDAQNTTVEPRGPLAWGQLNVLHTTDTHGWLEGHIREQNYGADWGDYVSFVKDMRQKARDLDVDLLVVDTGVSFSRDISTK
jgi:2',3'-cyclic-nucleotide 2'-phosphodiesterase (5'-nucleotidase family)